MDPNTPSAYVASSGEPDATGTVSMVGTVGGPLEVTQAPKPPLTDQSTAAIEDVTLLLHQAALAACDIGDREGATSEHHPLGLGIYLAHGHAARRLPDHHVISQDWPPVGPPAQNDPAALVTSAETRLRSLDPTTVTGLSDLIREGCDLVRECRDAVRRTQPSSRSGRRHHV